MSEASSRNPERLNLIRILGAASLLFVLAGEIASQVSRAPAPSDATSGQFAVKVDGGAILSLRRMQDRVDTDYIQTGRRLGDVFIRYRGRDGAWVAADTAQLAQSG